jgi:hypothetical protein
LSKKSQKIKLLYGSLQASIPSSIKKKLLKIWGDSVKKLKEKRRKTLKKRIICMKALRNHQFRDTKFIE